MGEAVAFLNVSLSILAGSSLHGQGGCAGSERVPKSRGTRSDSTSALKEGLMTRKGTVRAALLCVAALFLGGKALAATPRCAAHEEMVKVLATHYSEAPKAVGLVNENRVVEIFVSKAGSWTILVTQPGGNACILAAGQDWEEVPLNLQSLDPAA
jgi:hypothetical protein